MPKWPRWRLKSPASRLFTQSFIRAQIKENIKAPRHWPLCGEFTGTGEFPAQMASNAENFSIWWRHFSIWWRHHESCDTSIWVMQVLPSAISSCLNTVKTRPFLYPLPPNPTTHPPNIKPMKSHVHQIVFVIMDVVEYTCLSYGPLTRYVKLRVVHAPPGMPGTFPATVG